MNLINVRKMQKDVLVKNKNDLKEDNISVSKRKNKTIKSYFADIFLGSLIFIMGFVLSNKGLPLFSLEAFNKFIDSFFSKSEALVSIKHFETFGAAIIMIRLYDIWSIILDKVIEKVKKKLKKKLKIRSM
jgi:hypothetical protein